MQLEQHFADQMGTLLGPDFPTDLVVAVSGGGDSMVMLHLAAGWARRFGVRLWPVTVDHGLRAQSADEARMVADEAAGLGLSHQTLHWNWDGQGNLQNAARQARLSLIGAWAGERSHVLMAHTQDDQAETVLMRLVRGSGVDGLAGMAARHEGAEGMVILRPLLDIPRAALRHHATVLKIPFVDDPSNDDDRFGRVRMRQLMAGAGLDAAGLAQTAGAMRRARAALKARANDVAAEIRKGPDPLIGHVTFDRDGLAAVEAETRLRLVADALIAVATATYRPRLRALQDAVDIALSGGTSSLHGCLITATGERVVVCREWNAVKDLQGATDVIWDRRWRFDGPHAKDLVLRPMGEAGLAELPDWRAIGVPRAALLACPAVWRGDVLIAAPVARYNPDWTARIDHGQARTTVPH